MNAACTADAPALSAKTERNIPWIPRDWRTGLLRAGMRTLCTLAPALAVRVVDRLWFTPPRLPLRPEAADFLRSGQALSFRVHDRHVAAWSWGPDDAGTPTVLLVHGWGGHAGQLQAFVAPLLAAGYRVVAFDAPAHGGSAPSRLGGRRVSFLEFAAALREVAATTGPIAGLIAHSSGCTAVALAIRDGWSPPPRLAFVAPFVFPDAYAAPFARMLGISARVMAAFRAAVERRFERPWSDFDIPNLPQAATVPPLLLVHDREDAEVPFADGEVLAAAWPQTRLTATRGLGHRRLLRDAAVVQRVVGFVAEAAPDVVAAAHEDDWSPADARGELDRHFEAISS